MAISKLLTDITNSYTYRKLGYSEVAQVTYLTDYAKEVMILSHGNEVAENRYIKKQCSLAK